MALTRQEEIHVVEFGRSETTISQKLKWSCRCPAAQARNPKPEGETAMRFMMLVRSAENSGPPPKALMDAIGKMAEEATKAGLMLQSGGLAPTAMSSRVRLSQGKLTAIDGPFTESKEVIGGFAVFEFKSREEAIESAVNFMELHKQHWPGWDGETEVRQIFGPEDYSPRP
jgi:hypothetical protein